MERRPIGARGSAEARVGSSHGIFSAQNLHKTYRLSRHNVVRALCEVDVSVEAGEMVGIYRTACDKGTLIHIGRLLHSPDKNTYPPMSLMIDGIDVSGLSDRARTQMRAKLMRFVFQAFNLLFAMTALETLRSQPNMPAGLGTMPGRRP